MVSKDKTIEDLKTYIGCDLSDLAEKFNITIFKDGKQNKGWKGHVLERLAGLTQSSSRTPDGLSWELKSVSFYITKNKLKPKETMAITMINPDELIKQPFFKSHCWEKLKSIIFCAVMWNGKYSRKSELLSVTGFDFNESDELICEIKSDYDLIREKLNLYGFDSLTGRDGKWIQPRTKGAGHGSKTRAFYARKELIERIFNSSN